MSNEEQILRASYYSMSKLWCSPQDVNVDQVKNEAREIANQLEGMDEESGGFLKNFLQESLVSEEEYIDLFELNPKCPLYLGSHVYEEPKTCAGAGVSDRNDYMIDLVGIYKHFGWSPDVKELPDYLPSIMEFLGLTVQHKEDPVRKKLIKEYMLPFLPPIRSRLEALKTPYLFLLKAGERILNFEEEATTYPPSQNDTRLTKNGRSKLRS